jgi:hypothetical protein
MKTLAHLALLLPVLTLADVALSPAHAHDRAHHSAAVIVRNDAGTTVRVSVAGGAARTLAPGETAAIAGPFGEVAVRASYVQFGVERTLLSTRAPLAPHRDAYLTLTPATTARVLVTNDTREVATVRIDGAVRGTLAPGEGRVLTTPADWTVVELDAPDGRPLHRESFGARLYVEHRVTAVVRTGDLLVENPFPFAVELVSDRGVVRTVSAYGRTVYEDVPAGPFPLSARRAADDHLVDAQTSYVRAGVTVDWRLDAPTTGTLRVDSDHERRATLLVSGRIVATLDPFEHESVLLPVGTARVEVRDDRGRSLVDRWVTIAPFDDARLVVDDGRGRSGDADGYIAEYDPDANRDHHEEHGASCQHR